MKESKKITIRGIKSLEDKARKTSDDARELGNLRMNASIRASKYEGLVKEFETQSIIKGYEDAIGEMYETALPPVSPSSPNKSLIMALSLLLGLFFGIFLILFNSLLSNKVFNIDHFKATLGVDNSINLSKNVLNVKTVIRQFLSTKFSSNITKDIFRLQGICSKIFLNFEGKKSIIITCASMGNQNSNMSLAIILGYIFSLKNLKTSILDASSISAKNKEILYKLGLKRVDQTDDTIMINSDVSYVIDKYKSQDLNNYNPIIVKIVDYIDREPEKLEKALLSDFLLISSVSGKTNIEDLEIIKSVISYHLNDRKSGVFIEN